MNRFLLLFVALLLTGCSSISPASELPQVGASFAVREAVNSDSSAGFARVTEARPFRFPADHGPHPEYQIEWWYWTGNFDTPDGRHLGVQFTIFRRALSADPPERSSPWAARNLYMAHLAISDPSRQQFYAFERFARDGAELAGASGAPFQVFLEDWRATSSGPEGMTMRLQADAGEVAIDLTLEAQKPPVLQGDRGLSQKGRDVGNASYYYSLTRMAAGGTIRIGAETLPVQGLAWMDHEWSTSVLDEAVIGWDWFALQLSDGSELMFYQLRQADGSPSAYTSGTLVDPAGQSEALALGEVQLEALGSWQSPQSGALYPSGWRLQVEKAGLDLTINPYQVAQELPVTIVYWEGAVAVSGTRNGAAISGSGYVELTGYAEAGQARR